MDIFQQKISPIWVLLNGELISISSLVNIPPRDRPVVHCPFCGDQVIPKLGNINKHHFAHSPDSECALNNSETAFHFNTKIHLLLQLKSGKRLFSMTKCQGRNSCKNSQDSTIFEDWDHVDFEKTHDSIRPDITLYKEGRPVGFIEVCVFNPISPDKLIKLMATGLEFIEVKAEESLYNGNPWDIHKPLPLHFRSKTTLSNYKCAECLNNEVIAREKEIQRFNNRIVIHARRYIHVYTSNGKRCVESFLVVYHYQDGNLFRATLENSRGQIFMSLNQPITSETLQQLGRKFNSVILSYKRRKGFAEVVSSWQKTDTNHISHEDVFKINDFSHYWDRGKRKWIRSKTFGQSMFGNTTSITNAVIAFLHKRFPSLMKIDSLNGPTLLGVSESLRNFNSIEARTQLEAFRKEYPDLGNEVIRILNEEFSTRDLHSIFNWQNSN